MATVTYALCTLVQVKRRLKITTSTWDTELEELIDECTDWIEKYCGGRRFLDEAPVTEVVNGDFDSSGRFRVFLRAWPINSVTSIEYASGSYDSPTWLPYSAANAFKISGQSGIIYVAGLATGYQNIRVVYRGGFTTIPNDIRHAAIKLVSKEFARRNSEGATNESVGGASVTWDVGIDESMKAILDSYSRFSF